MKIHTNPSVTEKFKSYKPEIRRSLKHLRKLIIEEAKSLDHIDSIEETLKWGEPSYLVKKGSTIRIDWKTKTPDQYAIYFKCTSKLVSTFQKVYGDTFDYEKTRALIFNVGQEDIPEEELRACIRTALSYHLVKELDQLGMK